MAEHRATIDWTASGDFASNSYSRAHSWHFDGGASVPASSSPHVVPVPLSDPAGVDPEEALIASAASCHMLWFLSLAQAAGFIVASYRDEAVGTMGRNAGKKVAITKIELRPEIRFEGSQPSSDELNQLHHEAHERCFIANSLSTEIVVAKG